MAIRESPTWTLNAPPDGVNATIGFDQATCPLPVGGLARTVAMAPRCRMLATALVGVIPGWVAVTQADPGALFTPGCSANSKPPRGKITVPNKVVPKRAVPS